MCPSAKLLATDNMAREQNSTVAVTDPSGPQRIAGQSRAAASS